jgi:hypothetical protein
MQYQMKLWIGGSSSELANNFRALMKVGQYWTTPSQKYTSVYLKIKSSEYFIVAISVVG